jgi:phage terminase large subunit-like protein
LAAKFFDQIIGKYEGTRLGRQELNAELLEDTPGALWSHAIIEATRQAAAPHLAKIVVAIDRAVTSGKDADETGIMVVGKDHQRHGYVLADASGRHQPVEWAKIAVAAYRAHHADCIVAERNNAGAMVEATIRMVDGNVPVTTVWASRGKAARAEPVSTLYEQVGSTTSARSRSWRTRCARSPPTLTGLGPATHRTAWMVWCGGSPSFWSSRCRIGVSSSIRARKRRGSAQRVLAHRGPVGRRERRLSISMGRQTIPGGAVSRI